jgi:hypothetical protein
MINEKYTSESEKEKEENKNKKVLSDDAFAICETVEELLKGVLIASQKLKNG